MVVTYKLLKNDNTTVKNGTIAVSNSDKGVRLDMFQLLKKKTWQYLDQYDESITSMSKTFVDKLNAEL